MHVLLVDLGSLAASKSAELAAICLAAGGADQAAQHKTGLHSGPRWLVFFSGWGAGWG